MIGEAGLAAAATAATAALLQGWECSAAGASGKGSSKVPAVFVAQPPVPFLGLQKGHPGTDNAGPR